MNIYLQETVYFSTIQPLKHGDHLIKKTASQKNHSIFMKNSYFFDIIQTDGNTKNLYWRKF